MGQHEAPCTGALHLVRMFWLESAAPIRLEAFSRLALVVAVQLLRGRASMWLSAERCAACGHIASRGASDPLLVL